MLGKLKQPPGSGRIRQQRDYPKGYKQKLPDETSGLLLIEPRGCSVLMLGKLKQPPGGGRIRKQRDYPKGYKQKLPDETSGLLLIEPRGYSP